MLGRHFTECLMWLFMEIVSLWLRIGIAVTTVIALRVEAFAVITKSINLLIDSVIVGFGVVAVII